MYEPITFYALPGLAANKSIFDALQKHFLPQQLVILEWKMPHKNEDLTAYAKRFSEEIKADNAVLIGVSFGGILAQEIARIRPLKAVILISSVSTSKAYSRWFLFFRIIRIANWLPIPLVEKCIVIVGKYGTKKWQHKTRTFNYYLSVRDEAYLRWGMHQILHWKKSHSNTKILHLHGTDDGIFPWKKCQNAIPIHGASHAAIITHSSEIYKNILLFISQLYEKTT